MLLDHEEAGVAVVEGADGDDLRVVGAAIDVDEALRHLEDGAGALPGGAAEDARRVGDPLVHRVETFGVDLPYFDRV